MLTKQLAQIISRTIIRQIAHIQILAHRRPFASRIGPLKQVIGAATFCDREDQSQISDCKTAASRATKKLPDSFSVPRKQTDLTVAEERHLI